MTARRKLTSHSLGDHTPPADEPDDWLRVFASEVGHLSADSLFPAHDLKRLRELRPLLDTKNAKDWCEAGAIWLRLKGIIRHGKFGQAVQVAGYTARVVQLCIFLHRSGKKPEELNGPINKILAAIRQGKKQSYMDELNVQAERIAQESIPDQNSIVEADSLTWLKEQDTDSIPYIVSDPPFGIGMAYLGWTEPGTPEGHYEWIKPYWDEMCRVLSPGGTVVIWQDARYLSLFGQWFPNCRVDCLPVIYRGQRTWSPLVRWHKPGKSAVHRSIVPPNLNTWIDPVQGKHDAPQYYEGHPCPKNSREAEAVVKHYTPEGVLVVDPFCGTGTIPTMCKKLGRKFVGVERNPDYVKLARGRVGTK